MAVLSLRVTTGVGRRNGAHITPVATLAARMNDLPSVAPSPPPPPQPDAARDRVRRYRARKRAGQVQMVISLQPPFIADLAGLGWLPADKREDRGAVRAAFLAFADHAWGISRQAPSLFKAP